MSISGHAAFCSSSTSERNEKQQKGLPCAKILKQKCKRDPTDTRHGDVTSDKTGIFSQQIVAKKKEDKNKRAHAQ